MGNVVINFCIALGLLLPLLAFGKIHLSDLPVSEGHVSTMRYRSFSANRHSFEFGGYNELLPYVLASPNQEDAGSCLYMAITGIAEWWLAKLNPTLSRALDGPLDLSERYIMNFAGMEESEAGLPNWRTDSVYLFNMSHNKTLRNSAYRFTKGWYFGEAYSDHLAPGKEGAPGAEYGTLYNWIDQRPVSFEGTVQLPTFERDVIFSDPESNQWNVGIAPDDIVEKVKEILRIQKAPVLVIYNQNSYWHAVYVIGFNDDMDNGNCEYTRRFRIRIVEQVDYLDRLAAAATDSAVKIAYEIRAQRAREAKTKIENAFATRGGCSSSKGVFYIRDSIYSDENGPMYDYDLSRTGDEAHYTKVIVFKEYDWLRYFANHISVVYPITK